VELSRSLEDHRRQDIERKYAVRYHKIRFFERIKLERRLKKLKAAETLAEDAQRLEDLRRQILHVEDDLRVSADGYTFTLLSGYQYLGLL
jgi:hypothetical protein